MTFVRSKAEALNIDPMFYGRQRSAREAAIPKDGPIRRRDDHHGADFGIDRRAGSSRGCHDRRGSRAAALPIGGLREKPWRAYRAGIKTVCIPKDNER